MVLYDEYIISKIGLKSGDCYYNNEFWSKEEVKVREEYFFNIYESSEMYSMNGLLLKRRTSMKSIKKEEYSVEEVTVVFIPYDSIACIHFAELESLNKERLDLLGIKVETDGENNL